MSKSHLKRNVAPKCWTILRKTDKFVVRPHPGAHPARLSMPVALVIKQLGYAKTTREIKKMLNTKDILVDQMKIKDYKYPIGFMDILALKDTKENFRILLDYKGRLTIVPIADEKQASLKICRVKEKTAVKKGKIQLNLTGNKNLLLEKNDFAVGDSVLIEVPSQKILQHVKLEKGAIIILTGGKHTGRKCVVDSVEGNKVIYLADNEKSETLKKYTFVIGKEKELIDLK